MKGSSRILIITFCLIAVLVLAVPGHIGAQDEYERVLVQLKPQQGPSINGATDFGSIMGMSYPDAQLHYSFPEFNVVAMSLPASQMNALHSDPNVLHIQPDTPRYLTEEVIPYGVENVEGRALWDTDNDGMADPGAPDGSGRLICLIDSGVVASHEDFAGVNFVGGFPKNDWNRDGCGHGTHVAGTIAAMNNDTGVVGVSPGAVDLFVVRIYGDTCGWAYVSDLISALVECYNADADIISMSLGGDVGGSVEESVFDMLYNDYNVLSVAAAGNEGGTAYFYPASYNSVISVGAVDQANNVAGFSRQNDQVELTAPGVSIYSTANYGSYRYMSGTSMAAPHVSAAAAVIWSGDPTKTNVDVREALQLTALDGGADGRDNAYGYGVVQSKSAYELLSGTSSPTAVDVVGFQATSSDNTINLTWETGVEIDLIEFNLFRAESLDGPQTLVNESPVRGKAMGSAEGATYQVVDDTVTTGTTYYYWLETVDTTGDATLQGPVSATAGPKSIYRVLIPMVNR